MKEIIVNNYPKSSVTEAIKTIRTNLRFSSVGGKFKTILITSSMAGEGKSFVSANLAATYANGGDKVLLIDCDLRRGRQQKLFGINGSTKLGFSNLLIDSKWKTKLNEYIIQNIDYMEKSQADIITNILVCLGYKMEGYWPAVSAQLEKDGFSEQESFRKEFILELLFKDYAKMYKLKSGTELNLNNPRDERREDVYKEIIDVLKEIRESKNDKTLIIIISCLATMIILVGGFFLYRFIRRKNSNLIENTKDLVASENK